MDWDADGGEYDEDEPQEPVRVDDDLEDIMKHVTDGAAGEILQRFVILMQEQRLQAQAALARESEKAMTQAKANEVMCTLLGAAPMDTLKLLDGVSPANILTIVDHNGLTLLHHACRLGVPAVVERVIQINRHLADVTTKPDGKPPHWTPLMVICDKWCDTDPFRQCLWLLLGALTPASYSIRSTNGQTPFHVAASRGQWWLMKRLCWGLYAAGGSDSQAFAMVESLLNSPGGGRSAGVVDHAFRSNTAIALWLQKYWGGRPLLAPPKPEQRGYIHAPRK